MKLMPGDLWIDRRAGTGDMDSDSARFFPPLGWANYAVPVITRVHFYAGSGSADLVMSIDHRHGPEWDCQLLTYASAGFGGSDLHAHLVDEELTRWLFIEDPHGQDALQFSWTDPGTSSWGIEVFWYDAENLQK